jgi:hypothetical protein
MRMQSILCLSALGALASGCSVDVYHYGAKNLVYAPCSRLNGAKECVRSDTLAEESWRSFQQNSPGTHFSKDFGSGYVFGFADYVEKGGSGNPPVVPPLRYRKVRYETPEGHQQIADWFAGCRAGVAAAMASGYRQNVILPMAVPPPKPDMSAYAMQMQQMQGMNPEREPVLPAPTPVAPPAEPVPAPAGLPSLPGAPPPNLPPANLPPHGVAPSVPSPASSSPHAALWPEPLPAGVRLTPPPQVRTTTVPGPWEDIKPTAAPADPGDAPQRLAAGLEEPTIDDRRLLNDLRPVQPGVWVPARSLPRVDPAREGGAAPERKSVAVGSPATPMAARSVRAEAPPPLDQTDDSAVIVSHRGARWQN